MSKFISILGLVVIAANAAYANLEPTADKRITLGLYFLGIVGAAIGKGYERLKVLQSKPALIAGLIAAAITAFVSVDPSLLTFMPSNVKSLLVIVAGVIVAVGKSLLNWNEPEPPQWRNKTLSLLLLLLLCNPAWLSSCSNKTAASTARQFINVLDSSAANTGIALRALPALVDSKTISPELGLQINEGLARYNAANKAAHAFLSSKIVFDDKGKATLTLSQGEQATAIILLNNLSDAAELALGDDVLGGRVKYGPEIRALLPLLRDVIKIAGNLKRALSNTAETLQLDLELNNAQFQNAWAS